MDFYDTLLAEKLGGGGGGSSVTVEELSVTQNGTYTAPTGKAYSPVNVNVSGGSSVEAKDVNFYDYDGTLLHSYTAQEFAQLDALPENPSHDGLTAQGWNWTKAQITAQIAVGCPVSIGQLYETTSGATEIDIVLYEGRTAPYLGLFVNGSVEIDWGDNSSIDTLTGTAINTQVFIQHSYAHSGVPYTIKIKETSGSYYFIGKDGSGSPKPLLVHDPTSGNLYAYYVYTDAIKRVRIGKGVTRLGRNAFTYCSCLESVTMHKDIIVCNAYAFSESSIPFVVFPPISGNSLSSYVFNNSTDLWGVSFVGGMTYLSDHFFSGCKKLKSCTIPNTVETLGSNAFANCPTLNSVVLPTSCSNIQASMFTNSYIITKLTVPSSYTTLGATLFNNCQAMKEIHFKSLNPPSIQSTTFSNMATDVTFYVPSASVADYKSASNWSSYATQIVGE